MVRYSFNTRIKNAETIKGTNGYGYATKCMLKSWDSLGFDYGINEPNSDVGIVFDQPQHAHFYDGQYKILFHPWESTLLQPGWAEKMNECDEIWTPSPLIADWYRSTGGVKVPVYVYEHGIEHEWRPVRREPESKIKFLHVGAEATRKGGWDTVKAFRQAFGPRQDVSLTMKMVNSSWNGINNLGRVSYVDGKYTFDQMRHLFYTHDVYVYPSAGEGFGLTPLQALATGMPTITVPAWAPYERFLDERLNVGSKLVTSPWPKIHPGKIFRPSFDDIIDSMRYAADNYDEVRDFATDHARAIHDEYDWDTITAKVFGALESRLENNS